ncbi:Hypothetical predicted protein [Octopus vulgaris]|uniref:Uncharacterized protein n=1 Tax=Octopus vulgaris TaxID=6645 RepID=A0AA36AQJ8_OCTVU|nr:Hypothetical predicted protein [Octopus vulgaris]
MAKHLEKRRRGNLNDRIKYMWNQELEAMNQTCGEPDCGYFHLSQQLLDMYFVLSGHPKIEMTSSTEIFHCEYQMG